MQKGISTYLSTAKCAKQNYPSKDITPLIGVSFLN